MKELQSAVAQAGTFAVAFIPGKDTVLHTVAHQRGIDAHVAVAEERTASTGCWNTNGCKEVCRYVMLKGCYK